MCEREQTTSSNLWGEEPYFYAWSEEDMQFIPFENPNYPKMNISMNLPRKVSVNATTELGITLARQSYNVYSETSADLSKKIGTIGSTKSREIVKVNSESVVNGVKWYKITYKTSSGDKSGYIEANHIDIPSRIYTYSKPVTGGNWTQDYGYNNHAGVDIGGTQSVYAFTTGDVTYRYARFKHPDDNKWYLISFGNYAQQSPSIGTTTYAHLSSFSNNFTASSLPSKYISTDDDIVKNNPNNLERVKVGSISLSAGDTIGTTGATGHATGVHLHFEISGKDPFKYVLFPDYGYVP